MGQASFIFDRTGQHTGQALEQLNANDAIAVVGTSGEVLPVHSWIKDVPCQKRCSIISHGVHLIPRA